MKNSAKSDSQPIIQGYRDLTKRKSPAAFAVGL